MEGKKRVVPREVCAVCLEGGNHYPKVMLNAQNSAEVIVGKHLWKHRYVNRRTESVGVFSMTEKGGMTTYGRKH